MTSGQFSQVVENYTCLLPDEQVSLRELARQYPYSQILHVLVARAARDLKSADEAAALNRSAVYATDRAVLKSVITASSIPRIQAPIPEEVVTEEVGSPEAVNSPEIVSSSETVSTPQAVSTSEESEVVAQAEPAVVEETETTPAPIEAPVISEPASESEAPVLVPSSLTGDALREDLRTELEKLQELKKAFEHSLDEFQHRQTGEAEVNEPKKRRGRPPKSKSEPVDEVLLEEIQTTHEQLTPESPKVKEQSEIIEQFIREKPKIGKARPVEGATDLSEDSGAFTDNIISETLVGILLKQGKKEKAIEVLRKLIWKFPQKKAYFAAQIDQLNR